MGNIRKKIEDVVAKNNGEAWSRHGITSTVMIDGTPQRFIEFMSDGEKPEGHAICYFSTEDEAELKYLENLYTYMEPRHPGTLIWRHPPKLEHNDVGAFNVYSRLIYYRGVNHKISGQSDG